MRKKVRMCNCVEKTVFANIFTEDVGEPGEPGDEEEVVVVTVLRSSLSLPALPGPGTGSARFWRTECNKCNAPKTGEISDVESS